MWKIHRYYLREVVVTSALTFSVVFGIMMLSLVARGIKRALGGSLFDAAWITIYWTLDTLPHLLAISCLLATILTFARAAQDREITAIRSAGISPRVPMTAALLVGLVISIAAAWSAHFVLPITHYNKFRVVSEVVRDVILNLNLSGDRVGVPGTGIVMSFRERDGGRLRDCTVYVSRDRVGTHRALTSPILRVREAWVTIDEAADTIDVHFSKIQDPLTGEFADSAVVKLPLRDIASAHRREEGDSDLTSDRLLAEVYTGKHRAPAAARFEVIHRSCFALVPALLAPIGFCIGMMLRDRGQGAAMIAALLPLGLYYASDAVAVELLWKTGSPWWAWLPAGVLLAVGVPFCWRILRL